MLFNPSLDYGVADGFYDLIDGLVGDIYKQASQIDRLAPHSGREHYQVRPNSLSLLQFLCFCVRSNSHGSGSSKIHVTSFLCPLHLGPCASLELVSLLRAA